eukprot:TRINITY_DN5152_c0_g1_i2.p1 TRINITY_DN5152_c0_g1~~TRINITY_DN5152_c0_g1_i2.p1  ORF type:complete len:217 (+),score=42.73 TRINITY_DN5152_c0_g1_i2:202-852(+)
MVDPIHISQFLTILDHKIPEHFYILPWNTPEYQCNFFNEEIMQTMIDEIDELVDAIDNVDPWVSNQFGIEGPGEGLVMYPISFCDDLGKFKKGILSAFIYKAKGISHRVTKSQKSSTISPAKLPDATAFVEHMLTESRLEQGHTETIASQRRPGALIGWIINDVKQEGSDELAASNLEDSWRLIAQLLAEKTKIWYRKKVGTQALNYSTEITNSIV